MNATATARTGLIPEGERVVLSIRPDPASIVLRPIWMLAALAALGAVVAWTADRWPDWTLGRPSPGRVWAWVLVAAAACIAWQAVDRAARLYVLTDRRILRVRGVFRRSVVDCPLDRIQHITLTRLFRERLTGLGTLGFATAGTDGVEAHWVMIAKPVERLEMVRRAVKAASGSDGGVA